LVSFLRYLVCAALRACGGRVSTGGTSLNWNASW
jgi:hypothetical protein